ncbi:NADP-specific glutamate dehydrogenase [Histidinibacterium aquaticum]|uniref:Glutamate dehydrogenase n=1 Tax=Histidinibacterium aquaticum TaxID=2613962 RepID=A0A5J5GKL0_9RHOB|nr:NADP-specific glutamate dehydrogenase [Histidinibacterium aquaticum]KAA9008012.1 NADP-specific glutamate dehydrogenase [Histidinibacterium aquaticum]
MPDRDDLVESYLAPIRARNSDEPEFLQAVEEVARDVVTVEKQHPEFARNKVLERLTEPDRLIRFRVVWQDDAGEVQVNRGWRVQTSNAIGPYKAGLRFHPSVNLSVLKFLGFEQVFKNALTGLPLGGGKGGADFDPTGRSESEVMRFCQAFMLELAHHIGPDHDVPAGDINVSPREIGWLFGAYKKMQGRFHGAITGKGTAFGGSELRVEATGYGLIYFVQAMLAERGRDLSGRRVAVSGKGNVATHAAEKAVQEGARVVTLSDTSGTLLAPDGMGQEAIDWVRERKRAGEDIADPPGRLGLTFREGALPWEQEAEIALPCATQNEISGEAARSLIDGGCGLIAEGANMLLTAEAAGLVQEAGIDYAPGKAANAGGVAVSGLEMSQDAKGRFASGAEIDSALRGIMAEIHGRAAIEGRDGARIDYRRGANIAGYRKVARAICAFGVI